MDGDGVGVIHGDQKRWATRQRPTTETYCSRELSKAKPALCIGCVPHFWNYAGRFRWSFVVIPKEWDAPLCLGGVMGL